MSNQPESERLRALLDRSLNLLLETSDYAAGGAIAMATDRIWQEAGLQGPEEAS